MTHHYAAYYVIVIVIVTDIVPVRYCTDYNLMQQAACTVYINYGKIYHNANNSFHTVCHRSYPRTDIRSCHRPPYISHCPRKDLVHTTLKSIQKLDAHFKHTHVNYTNKLMIWKEITKRFDGGYDGLNFSTVRCHNIPSYNRGDPGIFSRSFPFLPFSCLPFCPSYPVLQIAPSPPIPL